MNPTANDMWLARADDGRVMASVPYALTLPSGLESGEKLQALLEECERTLRDLKPDRVVVLDPEATAQIKFGQARARATGETLLALAAHRMSVPFEKLSRAGLRSRLGLGRKGKLSSLVGQVVSEPLSPYWKDKRDLAALAALAGTDGQAHAEG